MKEIQVLLKILSDGLKAIAQGIEAVSEKVDDIATSQAAEKPKAAAKTRAKKPATAATKKKPARKAAVQAPKKKAAAKAPEKKAGEKPTAAEAVYSVIGESKAGVDTATLAEKTGFDRKKVANTIYRLGKQGKIASISRGVYVAT
jgi:hypothetical protein